LFDYSLCLVYIHTLVLFKLLIVLFIYVFSHIIHFILSICIYSHSSSSHFMPYVFKITLMLYAITPKLTLSILCILSDELARGGVEFLLLIHLICLRLCVSVSLSPSCLSFITFLVLAQSHVTQSFTPSRVFSFCHLFRVHPHPFRHPDTYHHTSPTIHFPPRAQLWSVCLHLFPYGQWLFKLCLCLFLSPGPQRDDR